MEDKGFVPDTVKLISAEGHEFIVDRKAAMVSGTIKSMLSGPGIVLFTTVDSKAKRNFY
jgi:hypothetical protein